MYDSDLIARYVIAYCNGNGYFISNLKLQKLLYFIQIKFLIEKQELCFSDDIIAVDFGVMVPKIFEKYKDYGSSLIPYSLIFDRNIYPIKEIDKEIIDRVISDVGNYSSTVLFKRIMDHKAWKEAYQSESSKVITKMKIEKYLNCYEEKKPLVKAKIYSFEEYKRKHSRIENTEK